MEPKKYNLAFPLIVPLKYDKNGRIVETDVHIGLSKREHFAGLAMAAMISNPKGMELIAHGRNAAEMADSLLEELSK